MAERNRLAGLVLLGMFVAVGLGGPARGDSLSVEQILERHYAALGGRERLAQIRTLRFRGTVTPQPGLVLTLVVEQKRPNLLRIDFTPPAAPTGSEGFDGKIPWIFNPFGDDPTPHRATGAIAKGLRGAADFLGPLVDWKRKGHRIALIGIEPWEDRQIYRLEVFTAQKERIHYFLDAETFLVVQTRMRRSMHGSPPLPVTTRYREYREVEGVRFATWIEESAPGGYFETIRWEQIELNVPIPDERFQMPQAPAAPRSNRSN